MLPEWNGSWPALNLNVSTNSSNGSEVSTSLADRGLDVVEVAVVVVMSAVAIVGFQANLCVAIVIVNNPCLRTSMTNLFVLNLVIVDLLASAFAMPMAIVAFSIRDSNQDIEICEASGFLSTTFMVCSMLTLCVISMDRFYSIAMPLHHAAHATPLIAIVIIVTIWLIGIGVACLPSIGLNSYKFKHKERVCSFEWAGDKNDRAFIITIFILSFMIPSLVILSMYASIFYIARKAARTVAPKPSESTHSTTVIPEPDNVSRIDHRQVPVNDREIVVSTIGGSSQRRPRIREVSISSDSTRGGFSDVSENQHGYVISYSSSPQEILKPVRQSKMSKRTNSRTDLDFNFSSPQNTESREDSITSVSAITSHLNSCDRQYCERHPNDNRPVRFFCACASGMYANTKKNVSDNRNISQNNVTAPTAQSSIMKKNNSSSSSTNNSRLQDMNNQPLPQKKILPKPPVRNFSSQPIGTVTNQSTTQVNGPALPLPPRPKHTKAFRTVMVIVLSYLILWGPYFVCQVHGSRGGWVAPSVQLLVTWLGFASYSVHPFLYGGMNRLIRDELSHLYREMLVWLRALVFCVCWSCCRCCACIISKDFFTSSQNNNNNNNTKTAVLYCMPWLRKEEEEEDDEYYDNELSEIHPGGGRRKRNRTGDGGNGKDDNENNDDHQESFFQFLQRTQEEDSHVPMSLVIEN